MISVQPADKNRVNVSVRFPDVAALPQVIARVRRVLDLAADPDAIGAHLSLDPGLAPLVSARPGLRVPGAWDGFELAVRAIFGQQITVPAATRLLGKLVQAHGAPLPTAAKDLEGLSHLFPSPTRLAKANLAVLGMPNVRAIAVTSVAQAISADPTIFSRGVQASKRRLQRFSWRGVDKFRIKAAKIVEERVYCDTAPLRAMRTGEALEPITRF